MTDADEYLRERAAGAGPSGTRLLCPPEELTRREAQNLSRLHQFVLHLVLETPERDPFVRGVILEMHRVCVDGVYPSGGRFREMGETVEIPGAGFNPAPVYTVEFEINDLLRRVKTVVDSQPRFHWRVNFAALALHRFLRIHPFLDGNGRVGRAFHQLMLYKLGLVEPPAITYDFFLAHRDHYLQALRKADAGNFRAWFNLNDQAVFETSFQQWLDKPEVLSMLTMEVIPRLRGPERQMLSRDYRLTLDLDEHADRLERLISRMEKIVDEMAHDLELDQ